ncbi:unnamed protein product, partial [Discosporangium mesarthrocarpum]
GFPIYWKSGCKERFTRSRSFSALDSSSGASLGSDMKIEAPVATLLAATAAVVSACSEFHLVKELRRSRLTLSYTAVVKRREWWRLASGLVLFDLDNIFDAWHLLVFYYLLAAIERRLFQGSPSSYLSTLTGLAGMLLAPGYWFRELRFKEPSDQFFQAVATWATVSCFCSSWVSLGPVPVPAALALPAILAFPHFMSGGVDVAYVKHQAVAVVAGLITVMLVPDVEGARRVREERQEKARHRERAAVAVTSGGRGGDGLGRGGTLSS